jgi:hypothetical protein
MRINGNLLIILPAFLLSGCINHFREDCNWEPLLNGKDLAGWDTYLGPAFDAIKNKRDTIPVGLNTDPSNVFSMVDMGDEKVLRISGEHFGGISTKREFENYHLQLQFMWGETKWPPRTKRKRDSGLMYHSVGPQGADQGFWMRSHEFQIQEGDCGDYVACAGAMGDVKTITGKEDSYVIRDNDGDTVYFKTYIYQKDGDPQTFSSVTPPRKQCKKSYDAEKQFGEWNTVDLYCIGDTAVQMINGVVTVAMYHSRQLDSGKETPLTKGRLLLQSEGSEIFYRNIKICSIDKLPDDLF